MNVLLECALQRFCRKEQQSVHDFIVVVATLLELHHDLEREVRVVELRGCERLRRHRA